jgi:methylmalonyl-CoA mutase
MTEVEGGLAEPTELEPEQGSLELADPGDRWTSADWEKSAAAVLRKARRLGEDEPDSRVWEKLSRTTLDDIAVLPLGTAAVLDELETTGRPTRSGDWDIRVHLNGPEAKLANEAALVDLDGGATSLWLELGAGLTPMDLDATLADVLLDLAPVVLDAPAAPLVAAEALVAVLDDRGVTPADGTNLGADPIGARVRGVVSTSSTTGKEPTGDETLVAVAELARRAGTLGVVVDATAIHDLGASDAQELGYSLAVGAAYLRTLTAAGIPLDEAVRLIEFRYAATDEQFATIAKLRAARRLWARVVELSDGEPATQRQHAVTSRPMMSKYDPWVNMLRTTVAAFAAGVGGADSVTVLPFDSVLGRPDGFGRRIARNTSSLLIAESHVAHVADPAGGAYAVEKLTDDLAGAGWDELGRIEATQVEGTSGIEAALADGSLRARIDETAARREQEVARRRRPLTGLTEFPNLAEVLPEREPDPTVARVRRYGASFEALRDDPAAARVFLATMGSVAAHTARATFASNLLAAGGIAVDVAGPTANADELVAAYDGQPVVCLAGSDPTYAEWGPAAITALRDAGARWVVLAGKPGTSTGSITEANVDDSCAMGVDALAFLNRTREHLA